MVGIEGGALARSVQWSDRFRRTLSLFVTRYRTTSWRGWHVVLFFTEFSRADAQSKYHGGCWVVAGELLCIAALPGSTADAASDRLCRLHKIPAGAPK